MTPPTMTQAWTGAVAVLGGREDAAAASAAELLRRYAQPRRRYHTRTHIEAMLADADWLAEQLHLDYRESAELRLAVCAHDVVYDAEPGTDERASAQWARTHLAAAGVPARSVQRVESLVLLTADHRADAGDLPAGALLDADLAILAAASAQYDAYADAVRQEYAQVPDELWRAGRSGLLRELLERDRLYVTEPARQRWQDHARDNLRRELAQLSSPC